MRDRFWAGILEAAAVNLSGYQGSSLKGVHNHGGCKNLKEVVLICDHGSPKFWDRPQNQIPGGSLRSE